MKNRIILVDDDPSILELLRLLLENEGYRVQAFDSAAAALRATLAHPPDAAVIDLMMPGMTGLEMIQALRYDPRTRQLPVLVCSAYYGDLRRLSLDLGHNRTNYLRKPFQIEDMLDTVAQMVPRQSKSEPSREKEQNQAAADLSTAIDTRWDSSRPQRSSAGKAVRALDGPATAEAPVAETGEASARAQLG